MPVTSLTQDEDVDGILHTRYTASFTIESPPFSGSVTIEGGDQWADRLIAAIQAEVAQAQQVGAISI